LFRPEQSKPITNKAVSFIPTHV